jgi:hypothetical protein
VDVCAASEGHFIIRYTVVGAPFMDLFGIQESYFFDNDTQVRMFFAFTIFPRVVAQLSLYES